MYLLTAFLLGFLGSLHCVGMCGPIALSLPTKGSGIRSKINSSILYNLGRVFTYAFMGILFGLLGKGFVLAGMQQTISLLTGALLILFVLAPGLILNTLKTPTFLFKYISKIKSLFSVFFQQRSYIALFMIGVLNGFLPCGLVYAAILGAISTGAPYSGALFMAAFGLGTIPLMTIVVISKNILSLQIRNKFQRIFPVVTLALGILIFARGLNLDIPYISPKIDRIDATKRCH